jgi:hypothetical protein
MTVARLRNSPYVEVTLAGRYGCRKTIQENSALIASTKAQICGRGKGKKRLVKTQTLKERDNGELRYSSSSVVVDAPVDVRENVVDVGPGMSSDFLGWYKVLDWYSGNEEVRDVAIVKV